VSKSKKPIQGSGGGGKGGGSSHTPSEAANNLFSNSTGSIVDLISEGEIEGLVNGNESIYYNQTALYSDALIPEPNFTGVLVQMNNGLVDQPALTGFDNVRTSVGVGQSLPYNVYKTISFPNDGTITAVDVTISADSFFEVKTDGDIIGTTVTFDIEKSENGGSFTVALNGNITGKQNNEYDVDFRVPISDTAGTTAIRIKRTKADATNLNVHDLITFKLFTKIVEHKFTYSNRAVIGHRFDAKQFGNQLPGRAYHVKGIKCSVPSNYDPVKRTYTGSWDGTLSGTKQWTNNPAWVFYDLVTAKRYGLGQFFDSALIDLPSLYTIGKWCDDFIADGVSSAQSVTSITRTSTTATVTCTAHGYVSGNYVQIAGAAQSAYNGGFYVTVVDANTFTYTVAGSPATPATGTITAQKRRPRWVCNANVTSRDDAFNVLKELVSCFRGVLFWMEGKLWAQADLPRSAVKIVTNANVIDGNFTYSGESNRSRISVVNVTWNDPALFYVRAIETYEDPDLIREIGWIPTDVTAVGCTDRAQARQLAKAMLYAQEFESELCTYKASFDHLAVEGDGPIGIAPGDLILISDHARGNAVGGGRVVSVGGGGTFIGLQDVTECDWGTGTGTAYIEHAATGTIEYVACTYNGTTATVTLTASPAETVAPNDLYIVIQSGFDPEPFRVIKISETGQNIIEIAAVRYNAGKFAAIYDEDQFDTTNVMRVQQGSFIAAPTDLVVTESYVVNSDFNSRTLEVSWTGVTDQYLDFYSLAYSLDNSPAQILTTNGNALSIHDVRPGVYSFSIRAVNKLGIQSLPLTGSYTVGLTPTDYAAGTINSVVLLAGGTSFVGKDAAFGWQVTSPTATFIDNSGGTAPTTGFTDPKFRDCLVTMKKIDGTVLRTESVVDTHYTYTYEKNFDDNAGTPLRTFKIEVQYRDIYGQTSAPATLTVANPAPALPVIVPQVQSGIFTVRYIPSTDPDFAGLIIWMSDVSGFTPGNANKVWQDRANPAMPVTTGGIYYWRYAGYDGFGTTGLTVSGELTLDLATSTGGADSTGFKEIYRRSPTEPVNPDNEIWHGPVLFDSKFQTWILATTSTSATALAGTDSIRDDDGTFVVPGAEIGVPTNWLSAYPAWTPTNYGPVWRLTGGGSAPPTTVIPSPPVSFPPGTTNYTVTLDHVHIGSGPGEADFWGFSTAHSIGSIVATTWDSLNILALEYMHDYYNVKTLTFKLNGSHANSGFTSLSISGVSFNRSSATYATGGGQTSWTWPVAGNCPYGHTVGSTHIVTIG
jgi:hypothetical protein